MCVCIYIYVFMHNRHAYSGIHLRGIYTCVYMYISDYICRCRHHASPSTAAATARKLTACRGVPFFWPGAERVLQGLYEGSIRVV